MDVYVCTKYQSDLSNSFWDTSLKNHNVKFMVVQEDESGDHQSH